MITSSHPEDIMENWKRQLIMDPTLNILLDSSQPAQVLVADLISKKQPEEISTIYSKLGSFKHSLTKHLKKEVELLAPLIIQNYHQTRQLRFNLEQVSPKKAQLLEVRDFLQFYNQKYNQIGAKTLQLKNCAKMLNFAKAYQRYILQTKLLKSLTKTQQLTNHFKISELIHDITEACTIYDFSGLRSFESERVEIGFLKQRLTKENDKMLKQAINKKDEEDIVSSIKIAYNLGGLINTLREYFNGNLMKVITETKKLFDPEQRIEAALEGYGAVVLKHLLDILGLEKIMIENGFSSFFEQYTTFKNLFGQFWRKVVETLQKLSSKFLNEVRGGMSGEKGVEIKVNYAKVFEKVVDVINEINLYVIQAPERRLGYNFIELREQFIRGLTPIATQYHQYVREVAEAVISGVNRILESDVETGNSIINEISSKVEQLMSRISSKQLFLEVLEKCCIEGLTKMRQVHQSIDGQRRVKYESHLRLLVESLKRVILESRVGHVMSIDQLAHFQLVQPEKS